MFEDRNKTFFLVLAVLFITNLFIGASIELSFDESYYWMYSKYLAWGYFDHPPMVAVLIKAGTALFGQTEFGVRFFFNILMCSSIYLIWKMVNKQNLLVFWLSVLSMPLIYFSGILALPDTPLLFFGTLYFYILKKYLKENSIRNIFLLALTIALMFYSKYHGILIVLLTIFAYPKFLRQKSFYGIVGLVVLFYIPHMLWQYQNDFVSFKFHLSGRVEKHFDFDNILNYLTSQIAILGFFNFFIYLIVFYKTKFEDVFERILMFNTFGFLIFLFIMSFRNQIEANWTVTCSVAFIILFHKYISGKYKKTFLVLSVLPITVGLFFKVGLWQAKKISTALELKDNRINTIVGWKEKKIPQILAVCEDRKIVGDNYQITSKLSFYLGREIPALHLNSRDSHYGILNLQREIGVDDEICFLSSKSKLPSVRIESYYKDPVFVAMSTTLRELAKVNGTTYEEIVRDRIKR